MDEYIERGDLLRQMRDSKVDKPPYGNWDMAHDCCIDIAEHMPTADVAAIVRCKYCEHFAYDEIPEYCMCANPDAIYNTVTPMDFCSKGERIKDNEGVQS